jgi:hypothetical protein
VSSDTEVVALGEVEEFEHLIQDRLQVVESALRATLRWDLDACGLQVRS